jgi:quercetin dioxygenase-like cupin family protein
MTNALMLCLVMSGAPAKQVQMPAADLKWEEVGPTLKMAEVSGNKKTGPYNFFLTMTAGSESSWHTHDADYTGVVVSGTVENIEQGGEADAKPLAAGSAWTQPAKKNHNTKCAAGADCVMFIMGKGGFTFHPMTAEGKPAPAPAKDAKADAKDAKK